MKRSIVAMIIVSLAMSVLPGCGSNDGSTSATANVATAVAKTNDAPGQETSADQTIKTMSAAEATPTDQLLMGNFSIGVGEVRELPVYASTTLPFHGFTIAFGYNADHVGYIGFTPAKEENAFSGFFLFTNPDAASPTSEEKILLEKNTTEGLTTAVLTGLNPYSPYEGMVKLGNIMVIGKKKGETKFELAPWGSQFGYNPTMYDPNPRKPGTFKLPAITVTGIVY